MKYCMSNNHIAGKNDLKTMLQTVIQDEFSRQKETKQTDAAVSTDDLHTPTSQATGDSQQSIHSNSITHLKVGTDTYRDGLFEKHTQSTC